MKKILSKGLSWALAVCMVLTMLPMSALAVGGDGELSISGGTVGDGDYSVSDSVVSILKDTAMTVSGTTATERIVVGDGVTANLTFSDVSITATDVSPVTVEPGGTLNLTLTGANTLTAMAASESSYVYMAALNVERTGEASDEKIASLIIGGTGTLTAIGTINENSGSSSGIGVNNYSSGKAGSVTINGGTVKTIGRSVGIGGKNADIAITGGTVTAIGLGYVTNATLGSQYGAGIGGAGCSVSVSGTDTVVNAYGSFNGIGDADYWDYDDNTPLTVNISGGTVAAWSACTIGAAPDYAIAYNYNYTQSGRKYGIGGGSGTISITGGTVDARGYYYGIGGDGVTSIAISNAIVDSYSGNTEGKGYGIGGELETGTVRSIMISGSATVGVWLNENKNYGNIIGGGDNSGSTITIKDDAVVPSATVIGSSGYDSDTRSGYAGGTITILGNATVGGTGSNNAVGHIGGSDSANGEGTGGAGGDITINTTGRVNATSIGGGSGYNGGAGGNITIQSGDISTYHIGGGDGKGRNLDDFSAAGTGGDGGNISISGGEIGDYCGGGNAPRASTNTFSGTGANTYYYASAGIGGGGGTLKGGSGGIINISGGTVYANAGLTVYDPATGNTATSGTGVGGAGIGGGNGASGGTINISGGNVEVTGVDVYPYDATTATATPALIGGGSAGGAGQITISGGYVIASVSPYNAPVYGSGSTVIGQGKGSTDATGWVKVTGGTLSVPPNKYADAPDMTIPNPLPSPWPTSDGSTKVYMATLDLNQYYVTNWPSESLNLYGCEITSMVLKDKNTSLTYAYGTQDLVNSGYIWLPASTTGALYDITLNVKKDNTVYGFSGTVIYSDNSNIIGDKIGSTDLTCTGEVIESLQITSDWGNQVKTYEGTDHMPTFTVKNMAGETLTEDTDYTLKIEYIPNDGYGVKAETSEIKNAGGYYVTATGVAGTDYEGMTATLDELWINPKEITGIYSGGTFTKQYDGTTDVFDSNGDEVESITLTVNSADLCSGDALTNIVADNPRYASSGVGTGITVETNGASYTYTQNSVASNIYNYTIAAPTNLTGNITVKVIGETNLDASGVTVSKDYDGTTSCSLTNVSGSVLLKDLVGNEVATVTITGVSAYDSADTGDTRTVTLTIGSLSGANAANYTLAGGATTVQITNAKILPADYTYNLTEAQQAQEFTQGGGISQISLPQTANGVNGETVTGTVTLWHDAACTASQANDTSVNALTVGSHSLYVKFVPSSSEANYDTTKITTGEVVVLTVVEGDPQELSFATPDAVSKTYGDSAFINLCTNNSAGGAVTYASGNTSVAEVNETTGEVTIKGAGTAVITATAAKVEGTYRETSVNYTLTVSKKAVTVIANNASRKFGEANPAFSLADPSGVLVSGDTESNLGITLTTTATATSNAGNYSITGTSTSANYNVTVTPGTLTVGKADAPTVSGINKNLLYSAAHTDVAVNITSLPSDCGTKSFVAGTVTGDTAIIDGSLTSTVSGIKFSTAIGTENQTATIPVTVTMQNYEDVTINVVVTLVDKTPVTITGVTVENKTYDGVAAAYTGTPANEQSYTGEYEYIWSSGTAPKDVGNYTLTVKIPDDNADFMGEVEIQFEISRRALTAKPQNISIYNGAALPTSFTLEYAGLVSGDTITPTGTPEFALKNGADALANSSTNGTYTIEWTNKADVTIEHVNYTVTKADGTLTISTQPSYENGGGSSSTPATPAPTVSGSTATTTATAKIGSDGTATASVTQSQMSTAIKAAQEAAKNNGEVPRVEIQVSGASGASGVETSLPQSSIQAMVTGEMEALTLSSDVAVITFDAQAITNIAGAASGDVNISAAQVENSTLSGAAAQVVGNRPVYHFSVTSGGNTISEFGGDVTVSVPYTPAAGEDTNAIVAYYINANGEPELMQNCHYDAKSGTLVFTTTHFSTYAVGYNKIVFSDVSDSAWYADAVSYLAARSITGGTSETTFSPDATLTRGQFITLLLRAYGIDADSSTANNFADAGNTYYTGYLAAAKRLGISNGVGDNKFAPEQAVTRQDMFTMLYNALKAIDQLPEDDSGKALSDFTDSKSISSYAQDAMAYLVKTGVVGGNNGQLSPTNTTTRAQMAQVLYNLLSK